MLWKNPKTGEVHITVWKRKGAGQGSGSLYYDEQYVPRELASEKAREYREEHKEILDAVEGLNLPEGRSFPREWP